YRAESPADASPAASALAGLPHHMSEGIPLLPASQRQLADLRCKPNVVADRRIFVVALTCADAVVARRWEFGNDPEGACVRQLRSCPWRGGPTPGPPRAARPGAPCPDACPAPAYREPARSPP